MTKKRNIFYIATFLIYNCFVTAQDINTIAGNGSGAYCGDNGLATSACLNSPWGIVTDKKGNVYIADRNNNCIRKVNSSGIITTIAGTGVAGYNGDGISATTAMLNYCPGIAIDKIGNLYISDVQNYRIRKVDTSGIITTVAGTGTLGYNGDGISAITAQINSAVGLAVDTLGNIFFTDGGNYRIRKIDTSGIISTIAGNGVSGFSGDGNSASLAQISLSNAIATDFVGNIYFEDGSSTCRVRKINVSGVITTIAGGNVFGFSGDGGPASAALLNGADCLVVDKLGNIFIADAGNQRIRRIDVSGVINSVVGNGTQGFSGDGGLALSAELYNPLGVTIDTGGYLYIADTWNNRIRKIDNSIGVNEFVKKTIQINVYPNPNNGELFINGSAITDSELNIEIKDLAGRILDKQDLPVENGLAHIKAYLPNGAYFITFNGRNSIPATHKIIVNK